MKRIALSIFFVLILLSSTAFGQIENYGLKVGVQSAGAYSEHYEFNRVAGFGIYGFADVKLTERWFTTFDVGYSHRGFANSLEETGSTGQRIQTVEAVSRLSYISIASFINANLQTPSPIYVGAGPRFDFLINTSPGEYKFSSGTIGDDTAEKLNDFVVGGSLVAGIKELSVKNADFRVEVKYEVDLTNSLSNTSFAYRTNAVMLVLGFYL